MPARLTWRRRLIPSLAAAVIVTVGAAVWIMAGAHTPTSSAAAHHHAVPTSPLHPATSGPGAVVDHGSKGGVGPFRSVADLTGPHHDRPDVRYELTARSATITMDSGRVVQALTYNGSTPGPVIRARAGQLVEVVLHNADIATGVTIHWHGLDVPNAEDGVAGVTQDAVLPGGQHTYRFRPTQVGTFWYHSHQDAARTVARGLFGALVIDPPMPKDGPATPPVDLVLAAHTWTTATASAPQETTIGTAAGITRHSVRVGRSVRIRAINTDNLPQTWTVTGSTFRVTAIDGSPVTGPTDLVGTSLRLAGGGRYDLQITMPSTPVAVRLAELNQPGVLLMPGDSAASPAVSVPGIPSIKDAPRFDPLTYGSPAPVNELPVAGPFDRQVEQIIDTKHGRRNGLPFVYWTINGHVYPNIPTITVAEGDAVKVRIVNRGTDVHPMHLHGHHALVLSRNGVAASGSPWWTDTLGIEPGDDVVMAFRADNPGIWMDHCHNLSHAAGGMMTHLAYEGVTSPFSMDHGNVPE